MEKMKLSDNALEVLKFRYLRDGETPEQMINRVVIQFCFPEKTKDYDYWFNRFSEILLDLRFVPNTPTLINAGRGGQLSACFVLEIKDSIKSIFGTLGDAATVHKSGGGTGFDFSQLRPADSKVTGSDGIASGPISFMRVYDAATKEMKQGGVRRGANMGILRVDHPNIIDFIKCKRQEGYLANFNISVAITDEFMEALAKDEMFDLKFNEKFYRSIPAKHIMDEICKSIWINGEPGIIFIDRINRKNPLKAIELISSTNPCGEQPLPPDGSCNLGHLNLARYWNDHDEIFMYSAMKYDIETAVRFLDNGIDINNYPTKAIEAESFFKRRIGLGIMGLADLLLMAGYEYGSHNSLKFIDKVMNAFQEGAEAASYKLGQERGPYKAYDIEPGSLPMRRNGVITTVAPTGSCSIIANCSGGIEPLFSFEYQKKCLEDGRELTVRHYLAKSYLNAGEPLPRHFLTAAEISPIDHIRVQAKVQEYIDSGISKTVNVSEATSPEEIYESIMLAYNLHLKSLTLYRDNSRKEQAQYEKSTDTGTSTSAGTDPRTERSNSGMEEEGTGNQADNTLKYHVTPYQRQNRLTGVTWKIKTGRGKLYVTVNEDGAGEPVEVFAKIGKSGREDFAYTESIGRLISLSLRSGVPIERIYRHLKGISGYGSAWDYGQLIKSVPDAIAKILDMEYHIEEHEAEPFTSAFAESTTDINIPNFKYHVPNMTCPECNNEMNIVEGCKKCMICGFSKCGG